MKCSLIETIAVPATPGAPAQAKQQTIILAHSTVQKTHITEKAGTTIGAAQKDMAREFAAKLSSLKTIVWFGLLLFVFSLATLARPPLKAIIGSVTTRAAIMAGGLALMVLPSLVVGNELLILAGVALLVGCWFLAHRHGHRHGQLVNSQSSPIKIRKSKIENPPSPTTHQG